MALFSDFQYLLANQSPTFFVRTVLLSQPPSYTQARPKEDAVHLIKLPVNRMFIHWGTVCVKGQREHYACSGGEREEADSIPEKEFYLLSYEHPTMGHMISSTEKVCVSVNRRRRLGSREGC